MVNNKLLKIILMIALLLVGVFGIGVRTNAYTEEQKQQAKAWLSAHGYSPDAGGAAAAYQDYLNGKFDEELGITRESSTEDSSGDNDGKNEKSTESKDEEKKSETPSTSVSDIYNAVRNERTTQEQSSQDDTKESATEKIYQEATVDDAGNVDENEPVVESGDEETTEEDITLYDKPDNNGSDEIFVYVVLLVVAILIVGGIVILFKDKKNVEKTGEDQQDENL